MTKTLYTWTEEYRSSVVNSLRVAAQRFAEDAEYCGKQPGHERLAAQFVNQQKDTIAQADAIEEADKIVMDITRP